MTPCPKMYTAVFISESATTPVRAINVTSSPEPIAAYDDVMLQHGEAGESLIALVPGAHADWSYTYPKRYSKSMSHVVDPYELPDGSKSAG